MASFLKVGMGCNAPDSNTHARHSPLAFDNKNLPVWTLFLFPSLLLVILSLRSLAAFLSRSFLAPGPASPMYLVNPAQVDMLTATNKVTVVVETNDIPTDQPIGYGFRGTVLSGQARSEDNCRRRGGGSERL